MTVQEGVDHFRDHHSHQALVLDEASDADAVTLAELREDPAVVVLDHRRALIEQMRKLRPEPTAEEIAEPFSWVYYPWRRTLTAVPGPVGFRRLRLDRNRNKITSEEQERFSRLSIGVVGLSVGHAIAHVLALEGLAGHLRLADFDDLELSNLNRIPATVLDIGVNKAVVVARRIAELDPYLSVEVFPDGLTEGNLAAFVDGLDLVIEECDSLDMKLRLREEARARRVPVLMETNDRGLFDVERFDDEPERPLFHGLLGDLDAAALRGLSARDKAPYAMKIVQAADLSARMAASMVEIDRTVSAWPQLGGEVQLGAAIMAAAVRRFGLGQPLPSGRLRIDLDSRLDHLTTPNLSDPSHERPRPVAATGSPGPVRVVDAVVEAIRMAPSGGNSQPWTVSVNGRTVDVHVAVERTSTMDVSFRGSLVAIGAAIFNARVAAAKFGMRASVTTFPEGNTTDLVARIVLAPGADPELAERYPAMMGRMTNRTSGVRAAISAQRSVGLQRAAAAEGARLRLITDADRLAELADVLAGSDRLRYLSPVLHREMMSELKWPGLDRLDLGIDVRTLSVDAVELVKLEVGRRADVMAYLAEWNAGSALGDPTRDRIVNSSAVAVVTVDGTSGADYVRGGMAVERVWVEANQYEFGVQPVSPVFLYALGMQDLKGLSPRYSAELSALKARFAAVLDLPPNENPMLVLRLAHQPGAAPQSERLATHQVVRPRERFEARS